MTEAQRKRKNQVKPKHNDMSNVADLRIVGFHSSYPFKQYSRKGMKKVVYEGSAINVPKEMVSEFKQCINCHKFVIIYEPHNTDIH